MRQLIEGHGYEVRFVCGDDPAAVFQEFAATLDWAHDTIRAIQTEARTNGFQGQPRWPAIVLRTPKGWTGPAVVDGMPVEGTFRAHQVPLSGVRQNPDHLRQLEEWLRSYQPEIALRRSRAGSCRSWPRWRRMATGAWAPIPMPMAASCWSI